jgi:DnaJ-class molecular chaperone
MAKEFNGGSIWGPKPPKICSSCSGTGLVLKEEKPDYCPECDGDGAFPEEQK